MVDVTKANDWRTDFGIANVGPKVFFASKAELQAPDAAASQSHVLRRAFDLLKLDGVLCAENIPLVYFKEVKRIEPGEVARLHQKFWNHGGAPILVLVAPDQAHVYSGLVPPLPQQSTSGNIPALVKTLERASVAIREFLPTVESGEFFHQHPKSFDPASRVDRKLLDNLQATRDKLVETLRGKSDEGILDALLCRVVFVCYLFDREIVGQSYLSDIGLPNAMHLRDVLGITPRSKAKSHLYNLFRKLGKDFNGDLFSGNLDAEEKQVLSSHIGLLDDFFRATNVETGQGAFWPYDFAAIPVEAISAIYERFLKGSEKLNGAFYTPRFLAELVLDLALSKSKSLLGIRSLDPACGSGIFLVGLFNRIAEEWRQANSKASNDRRARELRKVLCSLHGVDVNPTACRITAFSLYLAYLDQLTPRDIQELQQKGHKLPTLVHYPEANAGREIEGNIWCGDFFANDTRYAVDVDLVVGNPPWGSIALPGTPAAEWCDNPAHQCPVPDKQISAAFVWKAPYHIAENGIICLVLPHGTIFNHSTTALEFQRTFFKRHAVDHVLNLVDYQFFLFEEARHPAVVLTYRKCAPESRQHPIEYWAPKTDWLVTRAEVITVMPEDRCTVSTGEVFDDLEKKDAPQIWKQRHWPTARDRRLIDRLSLYPRLRDHVRQLREKGSTKPWVMAVGFQPVRKGDDPAKAESITLPSKLLIEAKASSKLNLFLLADDCKTLSKANFTVRSGSNKDTTAFKSPHVLVAKGFSSVAYAGFDVSFQDFLRGIHGPEKDRNLLIFLTAYLRSQLAKYYLFHTSSNWGITRQQVHVDELLRLPFALPNATLNPQRSQEIVEEVAKVVTSATKEAAGFLVDREGIVRAATDSIESLIDEYFDILPIEKLLVDDTIQVIIPSVRPTRKRKIIPTIQPTTHVQQNRYIARICETLNGWARGGRFEVQGHAAVSDRLGIGVAVLRKTPLGEKQFDKPENFDDLLVALARLRKVTEQKINAFNLIRGTKIFDGDRLYLVKPLGHRFWTETAALNDADEIAGSILMSKPQGVS
jgi:hypothetical protein